LTKQQKTAKKTADGCLKAAKRAYAGQKTKPLDEQQIAQFLPLVHKIAQRAASYLRPPLTYEDLVSAGTVGLVKAARDYDAAFNTEFQTYAYIRIKGAILDELRGWAFIPPAVNKQIRRTIDLSVEITKQTGNPPSETELAEKLGLTLAQVYETFENARAQAIQQLDQRQRQLILLYYQQHLTMKQIAELFCVTEPRVSQLHATALFNLSVKLRQWDDSGQ
jgi:RNA polymerase sigma factor for flagellar operon FliA